MKWEFRSPLKDSVLKFLSRNTSISFCRLVNTNSNDTGLFSRLVLGNLLKRVIANLILFALARWAFRFLYVIISYFYFPLSLGVHIQKCSKYQLFWKTKQRNLVLLLYPFSKSYIDISAPFVFRIKEPLNIVYANLGWFFPKLTENVLSSFKDFSVC